MTDHCYHFRDREVGRILIPGCMGAAVYGEKGCTCPRRPRFTRDESDLEERLSRMEAALNRLLLRGVQ